MADAVEHRQQVFLINNREIRIDTDRRYYSPKEMKGLLEKTGFKEITPPGVMISTDLPASWMDRCSKRITS
jgi:hypothetical protein